MGKYFKVMKSKWNRNRIELQQIHQRKLNIKSKLFKNWNYYVRKTAILELLTLKHQKITAFKLKQKYLRVNSSEISHSRLLQDDTLRKLEISN
jgi:hypothetical protein